jgi:hypothetical protein
LTTESGFETSIERRKSSASFSSVIDCITFSGDTREVTLRDSGPV